MRQHLGVSARRVFLWIATLAIAWLLVYLVRNRYGGLAQVFSIITVYFWLAVAVVALLTLAIRHRSRSKN